MGKLTLILAFLACSYFANSQETPYKKFGKIAPEDFKNTVYTIDSSADAVVLFDKGSTEIVGNNKGWFSLQFKHHKRIHILKKSGYNNADVDIYLYSIGEAEEEMSHLKAVTYNLENGKVVESELTKSNIFKDKLNKNLVKKKFTLPNVKEGSIIEFEYRIKSDFLFNLQPWSFQGNAPVLWSEYELAMPQFLGYAFVAQGYHPYFISDRKDRRETYTVVDGESMSGRSERTSVSTGVTDFKWVMKDVPAIKEESFTSTITNYISKIEFQLAEYREPLVYKKVMGTWEQAAEELLKDPSFGNALDRNNSWMGEIVDVLIKDAKSDKERAMRIYAYVRDNFTCTDYSDIYMDQPIKKLVQTKSGSVAELNLLLTGLLRYASLKAEPVVLSTRSNGFVYTNYPIMSRFNYVICETTIDGTTFRLDASRPRLGFGKLPIECYNGQARVINMQATPIVLSSDELKEKKITSVFLAVDEAGKWKGNFKQTNGYYQSYDLRNRIKEKGIEELAKEIKKAMSMEISMSKPSFDSLEKVEEPLTMQYDFEIANEGEDIIYVNPMFGEGYKNNPFKSAERMYPVEMPYTADETFVLSMEIPKGYVLDELPKQVVVKLNDQGDASFEYRIAEQNNRVSLRSRLIINKTNFKPDEYETLREFFNMIVNKHNEQIVFKKKN